MARSRPFLRGDLILAAGATLAAVAMGVLVVAAPLVGGLSIATLGVVVAAVRLGPVAIGLPALMLLPWFVVLEGVAPALVGTLVAAGAAGALLLAVMPLRFDNAMVPAAAAAFVLVVGGHAIFAVDEEQFIQVAKYLVFVTIALAMSSATASELMPRLKVPLLASGFAAIVVHLGIVAAGLGNASSYYGVGERLGYAADGPHALALLATIVAGAGLAMQRLTLQIPFFSLGVVTAMLTGVRSALLGIAVMIVLFLLRARSKARAVGVLVAFAVVAVVTGAADVVTSRFDREAGEFASFSGAGSDRGLIWTVAIQGWEAAGPAAWFVGAGLQSVVEFEVAALGSGLVGHSDLVEILVNLGIVGLVAWLTLWVGLLRAGMSAFVLLPILTFGLVNGTLEYVAAITFGLAVAAACSSRPYDGESASVQPAERAEPSRSASAL
jgi:hypothetical protein